MSNKIWVAVGVALVVVLGVSLPRSAPAPMPEVDIDSIVDVVTNEVKDVLGGSIETDFHNFFGGLKFGADGTSLSQVITGTCDLIGMDTSHTATTTKSYDCAVTGVKSGDRVFIARTTNSSQVNLGWDMRGMTASSTNGYITTQIFNGTGGNAIPSATAVGSSTQYLIIRTQ